MRLYKILNASKLPKWLKIMLDVLLTITLVYWFGVMVYKILEATRRLLHWVSEKRNWWTFLVSILLVLVGSFIMAQFVLGLDPIGAITSYIEDLYKNLSETIKSYI